MADVTIKVSGLKSLEQSLLTAPKELHTAQFRAINATVRQGRNEISRDIPLNMPKKRKDQSLFYGKAKRRDLSGDIAAIERNTPLTWFTGWREKRGFFTARRATKKTSGITTSKRAAGVGTEGLNVRWYKSGSTQRIPSGFIRRVGGSITGRAFMRAPAPVGTKRGKYTPEKIKSTSKLVGRYALWPIYGPSVYDEFEERLKPYSERAASLYIKKLGQQINYILSKK